jgi:serine/threonine protein kinase
MFLHFANIGNFWQYQKPDNIGFDKSGTLKIFDFGLAKELVEDRKTENGLYKMTGFTGGIRYMAPEVGLCKPYNNAVDVYSWSMVFWYILALEPPFGLYTNNMFLDRVFQKHYRPATFQRWPQGLRELLKISWSRKIKERPSFDDISKVLRKEISKLDPILSKTLEENVSVYDSRTDVTTIDC